MNNVHPYTEVKDKRICPITGEVFYLCWSEETAFDTCDSCKSDAATLQQILSKLNQERKENER